MDTSMIETQYIIPQLEVSFPSHHLSDLFPTEVPSRTPPGRVYFILILQGGAITQIDTQDYPLHESTLVYLLPEHLLKLRSQSDDLLYRYLSFEFDYFSDFPLLLKADLSDYVGNHPCCHLDAANFQLMKHYFDFLSDRYAACGEESDVAKGLLFSLVLEVTRIYADRNINSEPSRPDELVDNFFSLLHVYYKREHNTTFYADRLCVSDKHLMRIIKKKTGQTFHYWLTDFVVREAKLLLLSTGKNVTEITEWLNFPNSSFFARFFRKHTGMSPSEFRKQRNL